MMDLMTAIKGRRSIRNFEDKDIPDDLLDQVLEAVRWAPSWSNTQCWEVVVIKDPAQRQKILETFPPKGNPALKAVAKAPVVLAMCARRGESGCYKGGTTTKFGDWFMYDLGIATQNLCLTAHALGLGTVIVGLFDHNRAGKALNLPQLHEVVSLIPIGYPAKTPSAPRRRETAEFIHNDKF